MENEEDCKCTKIIGHLEAVNWLLWPRVNRPSPGYLSLGDWTKDPYIWLHYVASSDGLLRDDPVLKSTDTRYWSIHDVQRYFYGDLHCEQVLFTFQYSNLRMPTRLGSYFWKANTALKLPPKLYQKELHSSLEITLKKLEAQQCQMDRIIVSDQLIKIDRLDYFRRKTFFRILENILSFQDRLQLVSFENLLCKRLEGIRLIQQLACFNSRTLKYLFLWRFVLPNENPILINYSYITGEKMDLFISHPKLSETKSSVWYHFLRATDKQKAKCKLCSKIIKTSGGTTTGLHTHLKSAHTISLPAAAVSSPSPSTSSASTSRASDLDEIAPSVKKRKLTDYFSTSNSLEETLSRLTALDGMPFRIFENSDDQRRIMAQCGYKLPKSANSIKNIVLSHSKAMKMALCDKLKKTKAEGIKMSLTLDEWTSSGNRRFMNINIHNSESRTPGIFINNFANLGLIRVFGSMPANVCIKLIEERLSEFGLSLKDDIVCLTTDGASVMNAVGRQAALYHQKCLAHGIQLAILDVLYKKRLDPHRTVDEEALIENSEEEQEDDDGDGFNVGLRGRTQNEEFIFEDTIKKVRRIIKIFRKSPTKNDAILQKYVKEEIGRELNLILDCRTRWSSMADMLERFLKLKDPIRKALIDLRSELEVNEEEFERLKKTNKLLEIVKATVEELCKRSSNLIITDSALLFMLTNIDAMSHDDQVAYDLATALKRRIKERRLPISGTLQYLHNPKAFFQQSNGYNDVFIRPNPDDIRQHVKELYHLNLNTTITVNDSSPPAMEKDADDSDILAMQPQPEYSIKKKLELAIKNDIFHQDNASQSSSLESEDVLIKIEMALHENGGTRGKYLQTAYDCLLTVPPTSVESERIFSSAGFLCNHLRSRLGDKTINALSFLRSLYLNKKSDN